MKVPLKILSAVILYIWQLPQNLAGLMVLLYYKLRKADIKKCENGIYIVPYFCAGGVSLGNYIFILDSNDNEFARKHELGHRIQSMILGPLYLLIVGLPSALFNIISNHSCNFCNNYYRRFPENWANRLGHCNDDER